MELDHKTPIKDNPAKLLAEGIYGLIPFVFGNKLFETVAYRYCTQFNENSKSPSVSNFFPEAFHNIIMAREGKEEIMNRICGVFINDPLEEELMKSKIKKFKNIFKENIGRLIEIDAIGKGKLARIMSALTIGDYASAYLGILYEKDPNTTESIQKLK
jgi:glucose/mannose-6-phosphate isomerase